MKPPYPLLRRIRLARGNAAKKKGSPESPFETKLALETSLGAGERTFFLEDLSYRRTDLAEETSMTAPITDRLLLRERNPLLLERQERKTGQPKTTVKPGLS